jgi:polyhydroxybutyrate depolymerase
MRILLALSLLCLALLQVTPLRITGAHALTVSPQFKLSVKGVIRDYRLFVPVQGKPLPLVLMLHGGTGTSANIEEYLNLTRVAARETFAVVYPQGIRRAWNDARTNKTLMSPNASTADDVAFLNELVDQLVRQGIADPKRIFISGLSNGGFMAMRMACEAPERFVAFAPIIASAPLTAGIDCRPARPLPVLLINGTDDSLVRFSGQAAANQGNYGAVELAAFWGERNGCNGFSDDALPDLDPADKSTITARRYSGCRTSGDVELLTVTGGGHQPPSRGQVRDYPLLARVLGVRNHDIDTAETIWAFFKRQR